MRSGKDWILMLPSYLILSLEVIDEDWMHRLSNQDHRRPLYVQCVAMETINFFVLSLYKVESHIVLS